MILIDLSRDIEHKMPVLPNHPQVDHHDRFAPMTRCATPTATSSRPPPWRWRWATTPAPMSMRPCISTPIPGAHRIDQVPLENFFTEAVCLDLSHKPLKSDISIEDLEKAEAAAGVDHQAEGHRAAAHGFLPPHARHAGLHHRLPRPDQGVGDLARPQGHRACSASRRSAPAAPGRNNFEVHHVCRDLGFTHIEGLVNLDKLVGKGRFRFIGFPLKIKGGTGSPIRAVAWLDG